MTGYEPSDPPRVGRLVCPDPAGADTLRLASAGGVATVPVSRIRIADAIREPEVAGEYWAAATRFALHLVARGRILPAVSPGGYDAWRVGPLDPGDVAHLRDLTAVMPPHARAVPAPGSEALPEPTGLLRAYLDAVADTIARTPGAVALTGGPYAGTGPYRVPELRDWAAQLGGGIDSRVRISLRVQTRGADHATFHAVLQVHDLTGPAPVEDAAAVWTRSGQSTMDILVALRRAAAVWPPLGALLEMAVPDELPLSDEEVTDLLGTGAVRLAGAGVTVHWPRDLDREVTVRAVVGDTRPAGSCCGSTGSWPPVAYRSPAPSLTCWPRHTGRWYGCGTGGCSWTPPPPARYASVRSNRSGPLRRSPRRWPVPPRSTANLSTYTPPAGSLRYVPA